MHYKYVSSASVLLDISCISVRQRRNRDGRALFIAGCFFLPWFWFTNVWLFWPYVTRQRRNAVIEKCATWFMNCLSKTYLSKPTRPEIGSPYMQTPCIQP